MFLYDEENFSRRHGFDQGTEPAIIIRYSAPPDLRRMLIQIARDCTMPLNQLRHLICNSLNEPIDDNNWSDINIKQEINWLVDNAKWYEIYDIIEKICLTLLPVDEFIHRMNKYFIKKGIGWKIVDGRLQARNPEVLDAIISDSLDSLSQANNGSTAFKELKYAVENLSKRPQADITGAIQHAMSALECYCRSYLGSKDTLGAILKKQKILFLLHWILQ